MATYTPMLLSGSTSGRPTKITATTSGGAQTIHTAHSTSLDHLIISAWNTDTSDHTLKLLLGATADELVVPVPAGGGIVLAIPREARVMLTGGLALQAYADAANFIWVVGSVIRIT